VRSQRTNCTQEQLCLLLFFCAAKCELLNPDSSSSNLISRVGWRNQRDLVAVGWPYHANKRSEERVYWSSSSATTQHIVCEFRVCKSKVSVPKSMIITVQLHHQTASTFCSVLLLKGMTTLKQTSPTHTPLYSATGITPVAASNTSCGLSRLVTVCALPLRTTRVVYLPCERERSDIGQSIITCLGQCTLQRRRVTRMSPRLVFEFFFCSKNGIKQTARHMWQHA
jgi:hypothetical protein